MILSFFFGAGFGFSCGLLFCAILLAAYGWYDGMRSTRVAEKSFLMGMEMLVAEMKRYRHDGEQESNPAAEGTDDPADVV